tara:strand:+ start:123 stop:557 length:435 start_codon:yes stop_codon:yes gene_type:complete
MINENTVQITGNVTAAPKLVALESGKSVAKAVLIHNRRYTVEGETKPREERVAIPIELWDNGKGRAEKFAAMVNTKTPILVKGTLKMDEWKDSDTGAARSRLKLTVGRWQFILAKDQEPAKAGNKGRKPIARKAKPEAAAATAG